jgi:hypothetical protein
LYLRAADEEGTRRRDVLAVLTERFALPFDDARLAMDRVGGGVVRAASGNPANEPDPLKDPLAWTSYRLELGLPVDDDPLGPSPRSGRRRRLSWSGPGVASPRMAPKTSP